MYSVHVLHQKYKLPVDYRSESSLPHTCIDHSPDFSEFSTPRGKVYFSSLCSPMATRVFLNQHLLDLSVFLLRFIAGPR